MFRGCSPDDFQPLVPSIVHRHYGRQAHLWRAGDPADWMYALTAGEVRISHTGANGERYVIEVHVAGDVLGQLPFFDHQPLRFTDAVASRPTDCIAVPREAVLDLLVTNARVSARMLATYSRWIRVRDMTASELAFQSLTGRVARKLVELASRYGEDSPDGVRIALQLTHETIADMLGASRENVSRALSRLARQGDVERRGGWLVIPRLGTLRARYSDFYESPEAIAPRDDQP